MKTLLLSLALLALPVHGQTLSKFEDALTVKTDWTSYDVQRQRLVTMALYEDYQQTRDFKNHPDYYEKNVLLGPHPSDARIRNYFLGAALGHALIAQQLHGTARHAWQYSLLALQVVTISRNKVLVIKHPF